MAKSGKKWPQNGTVWGVGVALDVLGVERDISGGLHRQSLRDDPWNRAVVEGYLGVTLPIIIRSALCVAFATLCQRAAGGGWGCRAAGQHWSRRHGHGQRETSSGRLMYMMVYGPWKS